MTTNNLCWELGRSEEIDIVLIVHLASMIEFERRGSES